MDFAEAYLMCKLGHPELAGWWGKLLGGYSGGGGGGGGGSDDDGGSKPFDELTWDQVIAATKTGKYKTFTVGDMKELDLGSEGIVHMQIVGIDADDLADGSGKAPLTFISKELLETSHKMNATNTSVGGWEASEMRAYLIDSVKPLIPANIALEIKTVKKYSYRKDTGVANAETTDDVWIPSEREIFGGTNYETFGCFYDGVFMDTNSRIKRKANGTAAANWWLRSATGSTAFRYVSYNGTGANYNASSPRGVALGFCL